MGAEERAKRNARVAAVAEYERLVGPTVKFKSRDECPKCGVPEQHLHRKWCMGSDPSLPDDIRKQQDQQGACPIEGEHLHTICPRCGYGWNEFTADDPRNREIIVREVMTDG